MTRVRIVSCFRVSRNRAEPLLEQQSLCHLESITTLWKRTELICGTHLQAFKWSIYAPFRLKTETVKLSLIPRPSWRPDLWLRQVRTHLDETNLRARPIHAEAC
jgi:hypothetical protein